MSDTKFTPGPWAVTVTPKRRVFVTAGEGDSRLIIAKPDDSHSASRTDANAHLIAAAPDLYAALEGALEALVGSATRPVDVPLANVLDERAKQARAVLAKARGE